MAEDFYEQLVSDYERMTDEPERLRREIPFVLREIEAIEGTEILDVGCGTGGHARALAGHGLRVLGIDSSLAMIDKALGGPRVDGVRFEQASVSEISTQTPIRFDAVLCLGNTLPHLVTEEMSLAKVSRQIAPLLRRGGVLIGQVVNVPWVEEAGARLLPVRSWTEGGREIVLTRHYVNTSGSDVVMIVSRLAKVRSDGTWETETFHQRLQKIVPMELERAFDSGPWADFRSYGSWEGDPLDDTKPAIIFVAARR